MTLRYTMPALALALAAGGCAPAGAARAQDAPAPAAGYVAYVAAESADQLYRIHFEPGTGARIERRRPVGSNPVDLEGPHGLAVSPDGDSYVVTLGHGSPNGSLLRFRTADDELLGRTTLGLFPATVDVTPDGAYAFVANFNLHGDHVPSSISKVHLPTMAEVARTETCVMPHGSRVNAQGTRQYSACMMDQQLVEIDVATGEVSRRFSLVPGMEGAAHAAMDHAAGEHAAPAPAVCSPTWAEPGADGTKVYVACNRSDEVVEIDVASWTVTRRFATGDAPYNLETTPDGRLLLVTLKNREAPATEVFDLATGRSLARVPNSTTLPHGVAVTADSRYAFISVEGVGSEPGKVDVIDLRALQRVADVAVGQQAGGIAVVR